MCCNNVTKKVIRYDLLTLRYMDADISMTNLVEELLSINKVLEDRNKKIIETSEEILQELQKRNNKLVKIRKICLDDELKITDQREQIKIVLME